MGAVVFQGFECSSRNITTAKVKIKNQQFDEAIESLNKELATNPNSDEALALLADINFQKKNMSESAKYALKCLEVTKNPQLKSQEQVLLNNIWVECYNTGISYYSKYSTIKNSSVLDSAISFFKLGNKIRPEILDFYNLLAIVYDLKGDKASSLASYEEYIKRNEKNYNLAVKYNFYNKVPRQKILDKLGNPKSNIPGFNNKGDSTYIDYYLIDGKELYVFSESENGNILVNGWNYDMPENWLPTEKRMNVNINTTPYVILAQHFYEKKDLEQSLKYVKMLITLEPDNSSAYSTMISIYQELNRTDEALDAVKSLIKSEPNNAMYITQLADLYQTLQKYDDAINTYQQALKVDEIFNKAVRNIAAAYKNRASVKQKLEQDKAEKDKTYKINFDNYKSDLVESAKYFDKALNIKTYQNDMFILSELANIYQVLEEKDKLNKTIRNLEAIEYTIPENQKEQYYLNMLKIYSEKGDDKKLEEIKKKIK